MSTLPHEVACTCRCSEMNKINGGIHTSSPPTLLYVSVCVRVACCTTEQPLYNKDSETCWNKMNSNKKVLKVYWDLWDK